MTFNNGYPTFANLKHGDIVFNHKQTEQLKKKGYITNSHAKIYGGSSAFADGTIGDEYEDYLLDELDAFAGGTILSNAYAGVVKMKNLSTSSSKSSSTKSSTTKPSKTSSSDDNKKKNTKKKSSSNSYDKLQKWLDKLFDWIEVKIDRIEKVISNSSKKAEYYVAKGQSALTEAARNSAFNKASKQYSIASSKTQDEIYAREQGYSKYIATANKIAEKASKKNKKGKTPYGLSQKQIQNIVGKIKNGTIDIAEYGEKTQNFISSYKEWYDKAMDCKYAIDDLRESQRQLFEQWANIPIQKAEAAIDKLEGKLNAFKSIDSLATSGNSAYSNLTITDKKDARDSAKKKLKKSDTKGLKKNSGGTYSLKGVKKGTERYKRLTSYNRAQTDYNQTVTLRKAMNSAYGTDSIFGTGKPTYKIANQILDSEYSIQRSQNDQNQKALKATEKNLAKAKAEQSKNNKNIKKKSSSITSSKAFKKLKKSQSNAIKKQISKGGKISTKGITDKALKKLINSYNKSISSKTSKADKVSEAKAAKRSALSKAVTSAANLATQAIENQRQKFDNIRNYYDTRAGYRNAQAEQANKKISKKEATGKEVKASDYKSVITATQKSRAEAQKEATELQKSLDAAVKKGTIKKDSKEWYEFSQQILDAKNNVADLEIEEANLNKTMNELSIKKKANRIKENANEASIISDAMELVEMRDALASASDYQSLIKSSAQDTKYQQEQIDAWKALQEAMDMDIDSDLYQEYQDNIDSANEKIRQNTKDQLQWNLSIRDLPLEEISKLNELLDSMISYYESLIKLSEASGKVVLEANYKDELDQLNEKRANDQAAVDYALKQLNEAEANGTADNYTAAHWEKILYENMNELNNTDISIAELTRTMNELPWQKLQNELTLLENVIEELNDDISMLEVRGLMAEEDNYRKLIEQSEKEVANYKNQLGELENLLAQTEEGSSLWYEYTGQIANLNSNIRQAAISQEEWNNAIVSLPLERLEKAAELINAISDYNSSINDLVQALGYDLTNNEYQKLINDNNNQIVNLLEQRQIVYENFKKASQSSDEAYGGKTAADWEAEYLSLGTEINNTRVEVENLKDSMREDINFRGFDRMFASMNRLRTELEIIRAQIDDKDLFDKDTGKFTEKGITALGVAQQELKSYQKDIETANGKIARINDLRGTDGYSEQEYLEDITNAEEELLNAIQGEMNARKAIRDLIEESLNKELEAIQKLVDKWAEALDTQREIYEYSKNIKKQTKEVANLEKQLIYLQGDDSEENKARLQQLKVSYEDAKDQLDETEFEHYISEQKKLVDELTKEWSENMSEYVDKIVDSLDDLTDSIKTDVNINDPVVTDRIATYSDETLTELGKVYSVTEKGFNDVNGYLRSLGSDPLPSHASGTRKAKTNFAWTNENGNGEIIRKSDGAILTPVGKRGMVFDNAASQRLWDLAHGDGGVFLAQSHFQSIADDLSKAFMMASQIGSSEYVNNGGNITISNMTIELPNVQNPEQFAEAFQDQFYKILTTKRGERAVQSVTTDRLTGGSTIGKYKR